MTTDSPAAAAVETKQQAGIRLANARMPKLKTALIGIGRLGDYKLGKPHISKIEKTIDKWVAEAKAKLNNRTDAEDDDFHLE
jgi:hypothetical protein